MNADGSGVTRLTNHTADDYIPTWSPDGGRIAFTSDRDGNEDIFVMNVNGTGVTRPDEPYGRRLVSRVVSRRREDRIHFRS